jgi:hypothetical protein
LPDVLHATNVHHQITSEVLSPPDRFWYYLLNLPFGIQNATTSFQLELEHLISHEVPWSTILSSTVGADVPSLRIFLEILLRNSPEYDSDDIGYYASAHMRYYTNGEVSTEKVPELTPPDQSPCSSTGYPREEGGLL